jgi:glycosyltransferase involved in cell wall biosynthesis
MVDGLVSIVMPVYNGERFVGRTLASALAQTYRPIEVVVVDDGSADRSAFLVEAKAAADSRVRFIRTPNGGVAKARNLAISESQGEFIAPMDADDLWHPEKIDRQVAAMRRSAKIGLVYCWAIDIDECDRIMPTHVPTALENELRTQSSPRGRVTEELAKVNFLGNGSTPLIRRSCIEAVGGYNIDLRPSGAEDWMLYLALSDLCEFAVVPDYLVGYRQWTGANSMNVAAMEQSMEQVTRWIFQKWPTLSDSVKHWNAYCTNVYLASRAIATNRLAAALRYRVAAYRARPAALLELSSFMQTARLLSRAAGLRRAVRNRAEAPVVFQEFQAPGGRQRS